jgi:hypothetical protein
LIGGVYRESFRIFCPGVTVPRQSFRDILWRKIRDERAKKSVDQTASGVAWL